MKSAPGCKTLTGVAAALVLSAVTAQRADGIIVMDPTALSTAPANTAAPGGAYADFGYWDNMLGAHTYLGNGYLLSTNHVGALPTSINIGGTSYDRIDQRRLMDPAMPSTPTDLWVWKIGGPNPLPNLPTILPILTTPVVNETTLIIGDGYSRANGPTFWDITVNSGDDDDTWTPVANEAAADAKGFLTSDDQVKRWGTNRVHDPDEDIEFDGTLTRGYATNFSLTNATEFESQATNHDSAGPVFVKRNGVWMLTGLMHVVGAFDGQPRSPGFAGVYAYEDPGLTGVVLGSTTVISDLSDYTTQLAAFGVTVPEPGAPLLIMTAGAIASLLRRRRR
jgi:hypothetical protein